MLVAQHADRRHVVGRLVDEYPASIDEQILVDGAELAVAGELRPAVIEADADHDMVVVIENLGGTGHLSRPAEAVGGGPVAVDFAQKGAWRNVVRGRVILVDRGIAVANAKLAWKRPAGIARLAVSAVAIHMGAPVPTIIGVALKRQRVGKIVA